MKLQHILLVLLSVCVTLFSTGCVATMLSGMPPPASLDVTNNIAGTTMRLESSRFRGVSAPIALGQTFQIPICAVPLGNNYIVRAKFYDASGRYLGVAQESFTISFDYSGRYSQAWVVSQYNAPPSYRR